MVGAPPIGMRAYFFCAFCIGLSEATRVAVSRNRFCNRENHSEILFENVFLPSDQNSRLRNKKINVENLSSSERRTPVALP